MTYYYEVEIEVDARITITIASEDTWVGNIDNLEEMLKYTDACMVIDEQVDALEWPAWRVSQVIELDDGKKAGDVQFRYVNGKINPV